MKIKTFGGVNRGKLTIYNRNEFLEIVSTWKDCSVELTLQSKTKGRSSPQNRYYWGCVLPIIKQALKEQHGIFYDAQLTHELMKLKFNSIEIYNEDGVVERIPMSTTNLTIEGFEEYLEDIRTWCMEFFKVKIPLPNEQLELL